jgi:hypothetical protein
MVINNILIKPVSGLIPMFGDDFIKEPRLWPTMYF